VLEQLKPTKHTNVIEVVKAAGIDVAEWEFKKNGERIANPSVNQSKIYRWSFGGDEEPSLLFIWHDSLTEDEQGHITYRNNLTKYIDHLANIASGVEKGNSNTARLRLERARLFREAVRQLYNSQKGCRVALLIPHSTESKEEDDTKSVKYRELDSEFWYVHHYDVFTGDIELIRGVQPRPHVEVVTFDDIYDPPKKKFSSGYSFHRSIEVKVKVLQRSGGRCEYCGQYGFKTPNDAYYLEVHHVVPLRYEGPDELWNTVALCADHHKQAHFGMSRTDILRGLLEFLGQLYPHKSNELKTGAEKIDWCNVDAFESLQS